MAGANRLNWPRRGSLQFRPRKRAKNTLARTRSWAAPETPKLLGYVGYKAGMTHVQFTDTRPNTLTKGMTVTFPTTIIECPSLLSIALVFYKHHIPGGLRRVAEVYAEKIEKTIKKPKKAQSEPKSDEFDEIRLKVATQPKLTYIGKKIPDIIEIKVAGQKEAALAYARGLLGKEIRASEVFKEGQAVDVHAVTKGKGFQGTVKRFGVKIRQHKSEKTKRGVGTLGAWTTKRVLWSVAQPGKMGYHNRTEYNKHLLKIDTNLEAINPQGGLLRYGKVKNEYILLKGSVPGPRKRPVLMTEPIRTARHPQQLQFTYVHKGSQQ